METKKNQTEWERAIDLMTEEELQFIIQHQVGYYPSFLKMVRGKRWDDDPYSVSENKAMMDAIRYLIGEMGGQCKIIEDDEMCFFCQGVFEKMASAINKANVGISVNIVYIIDKEEQMMDIYGSSFIPYFPNMTYLRKYLHHILVDMMSSHDLVDHILQEEEDMSIVQSFSQKTSDVAN